MAKSPTMKSQNGTINSTVVVVSEVSDDQENMQKPPESPQENTSLKVEHEELVPVNMENSRRIKEQVVYTVSLATIVVLAYGVLSYQWLLPYYYAVSAPFLLIIRFVQYWKFKWQYFLLDFCYFGNLLLYIYMWAVPWHAEIGMVLFGVANGPIAWATIVFRNSLVLHSIDKMTSIFIHILPILLTYGARWYPTVMSQHWYTSFSSDFTEDVGQMFLWLMAIPTACYAAHALVYAILVYVVFKPGDEYLNSYRYLNSNGWTSKVLSCCGKNKHPFLMFNIMNVTACVVSCLLGLLWYKYFIAHCLYLAILMIIVSWNGATFNTRILDRSEDSESIRMNIVGPKTSSV